MRKRNIILFVFVLGLLAASFLYNQKPDIQAASSDNVSGWAWSENIGWISFNSTNQGGGADYGVQVAPNGDMSGYAWSENIGWVSFNETSGCPSSPCKPAMNRVTGEVSGWAKALAADGNGWDGWIHLKGTSYGVTVSECIWDGYAWGSDVIGWIHFRGTNYGVTGSGDGCVEPPKQCADGIDNDGDGLVDLADPGCSDSSDDNESLPANPEHFACTDDAHCASGLICFEGTCQDKKQCEDGRDNDGDGKIDLDDPGCFTSEDDDERDLAQPIFKETTP